MRVNQVMTREVYLASPNQTIQGAARMMADIDAGALPVGDGEQLVGMITDRDIAIRAVAAGKGPQTEVREVMSRKVVYCYEDEDVESVASNMGEMRIRRMPVVNREQRLVGIVSLADLALGQSPRAAVEAVIGLSRPGGPHSQSEAA